ncbi:MAG: DUF3429 domain-containing protein [Rhodobacteraceae bacterium]|nr:DUF3429 domain-containing protein [Paracoccaceae bacterium]
MSTVPSAALLLGLAGVLPFVWGAVTLHPALGIAVTGVAGSRLVGHDVLVTYGIVILCFMSGVLWGFAARAEPGSAVGPMRAYGLSVLPALWAFFMVAGGPGQALSALVAGFVGLLALDMQYWLWGLAPRWWMRLRLMLTGAVLVCLIIGIVAP